MKKRTKALVGAVLAIGLIAPAAGAMATSTYIGFNVNLPSLQQGILAASQIKTTKAAAGNLKVSFIGGGFKLNARQCRLTHASGPGSTPYRVSCGIEVKDVPSGAYRNLPSGSLVAAGSRAWLELHNSQWTIIRVQAKGTWRAN